MNYACYITGFNYKYGIMLRNFTLLLFLLGFMNSCIEPYNVVVNKYKDLLVVDGCITNENKSHHIKLVRSIANLDETAVAEINAEVVITCSDGTREVLREVEPGVYKTDSISFVVEIGKTYKLTIRTSNGKRYYSEDCEILQPSEIDNVYYNRKNIISVENENVEGVGFFVDGRASKDTYLRWMYDEDWKFSIPYPTLIGFDENKVLKYLSPENHYCWKKSSSHEIIIQSLQNQTTSDVKGKEICFIPSDYTDRFYFKYALKIKQLSISKEEYEFWKKLKDSSEEVGDIFGTQPFSITGNIKSETDENEPVLGYFQAGSVTAKRIFLDYKDVNRLKLSLKKHQTSCILDTVVIGYEGLNTLYSIYDEFVLNRGYAVHDQLELGGGLLLCQPECSDCSLTGSPKKPSFWED